MEKVQLNGEYRGFILDNGVKMFSYFLRAFTKLNLRPAVFMRGHHIVGYSITVVNSVSLRVWDYAKRDSEHQKPKKHTALSMICEFAKSEILFGAHIVQAN